MGKSPFTMPGSKFYGKGSQSVAPGKYTVSPTKQNGTEGIVSTSQDEEIMKKAADRDKAGGVGVITDEEAKQLRMAQTRTQSKEIHEMSKADALKASGKKVNPWTMLTTSKKKLKAGLRGDLSKEHYARTGETGKQAEQSELRSDDEYTGVSGT